MRDYKTDTESLFQKSNRSDSPQTNTNPYYKPFFSVFSSQFEANCKDYGVNNRQREKAAASGNPIYYPEAIIEEPESAASSPVTRALMIGEYA